MFSPLPFIVVSRSSEQLAQRLLADDYPVLFEGLHCCMLLDDPRFANKRKLVRTHNIEHDYYAALAKVENRFFRRRYFISESKKLAQFEQQLNKAQAVLAIARADAEQLAKRYRNVHHVPAFHPSEKLQAKPGKGDFVLYHGNLEVGENNQAALYLVNEVFNDLDIPLVIAGNKPSAELQEASARFKNISIRANIPHPEIDELIRDAQINVLPTFQATGIKLKLLAALFNGRHCIVNTPMVANTGLEKLCTICDSPAAMKNAVCEKFTSDFDPAVLSEREIVLQRDFSNAANAKKIVELI
ncbi:MAG: putative mannosyltransferase [Bacteroidetes bacterium]|nr:MAG: putative mannosyltransferase [Bacteroidota bacterium]